MEAAVLGEHPEAPDPGQPLPVHQLYVPSLEHDGDWRQDLVYLDGVLPAGLGVHEDDLLVGDLQVARAHGATNLAT